MDIENKVMSDIKSGRIKLRSKYIFIAEKLGLGSAFALTALLAILFFNLFLFYLKATDNIWYLSFGSRGLFAFLESFPYLLVMGLIVSIFIAGFIIKRSNALFNKPFGLMAVLLVLFVVITGTILTFTRMAEGFERAMFDKKPHGMFFRPFLGPGLDKRHGGVAGIVSGIDGDVVDIQTPRGIEKVNLGDLEMSLPAEMRTGTFIMVVGEKKDGVFEAKKIRIMGEEDMPMIRRGVHRRFGPRNPF